MKGKSAPKGKAPTFPFYASDFYLDTIAWTDEMVGRHIRLMCQQWVNGFIEMDEGYPVNSTEKQKHTFDKIKHKYFAEKNGNIKNKRLDKIKKEKDLFIKKARKAGADGASKRWGSHSEPYSKPDSENIALQSSSSFSSSKELSKHPSSKKIFETMRMSANPKITDIQIWNAVAELEDKYRGKKITNLKSLCDAFVENIKIPEGKKMVI